MLGKGQVRAAPANDLPAQRIFAHQVFGFAAGPGQRYPTTRLQPANATEPSGLEGQRVVELRVLPLSGLSRCEKTARSESR